jgi:hypothetical protein
MKLCLEIGGYGHGHYFWTIIFQSEDCPVFESRFKCTLAESREKEKELSVRQRSELEERL